MVVSALLCVIAAMTTKKICKAMGVAYLMNAGRHPTYSRKRDAESAKSLCCPLCAALVAYCIYSKKMEEAGLQATPVYFWLVHHLGLGIFLLATTFFARKVVILEDLKNE